VCLDTSFLIALIRRQSDAEKKLEEYTAAKTKLTKDLARKLPAERAVYSRVQNAGFKLVLGPRKIPGQSQKEIDVQIAVDMISDTFSNLFDVAVLVTGDGDLAPAVRKILSMQKIDRSSFF